MRRSLLLSPVLSLLLLAAPLAGMAAEEGGQPAAGRSDQAQARVNQAYLRAVRLTDDEVRLASLQGTLERYYGEPLTVPLLNAMLSDIQRHYAQAGYISSQVYLPAQHSSDGSLEVAVRHGRIRPALAGELSPAATTLYGDFLALEGQPFRLGLAENALRGPGSLDTLHTALSFERVPETLDVLADVTVTARPSTFMVYADNHGSRAAGRYRLSALGVINNPLHRGDRLQGGVSASNEDMYSAVLGYTLPLSAAPWTAGVSVSYAGYELGYEYKSLSAVGEALDVGAQTRYALLSEATASAGVSGGLYYRDITDSFERYGVELHRQAAGGFIATDYAWRHGLHSLAGSTRLSMGRQRGDDWGVYADDTYALVGQELLYAWQASGGVSGFFRGRAQLASAPLTSYERLTLTGAEALTMYDSGTLSADSGLYAQAGMQHHWTGAGAAWSVTPHLDFGLGHSHGGSTQALYGTGVDVAARWRGCFAQLQLGHALADINGERDAFSVFFRVGYQGGGGPAASPAARAPQLDPRELPQGDDHVPAAP